MSNFPDDADDTGLVYVTAKSSHPYGKLKTVLRLPELRRQYPLGSVDLTHSAQFGGVSVNGPEPSYGWHLLAGEWSDGLEVGNLARTSRTVAKLYRKLDSMDRSTGPTGILPDYLCRLIHASGVKYVYVDHEIDSRRSIPDMTMWMPKRDGMAPIHSAITVLCRALAVKFP